MAKAIGTAIEDARKRAGLSAVQVSARADELGRKIHRVALGKMESGERDVTVEELVTIAKVLNVPPLQLIYPPLPDGEVEAWPGETMRAIDAAQWFSGVRDGANTAIELSRESEKLIQSIVFWLNTSDSPVNAREQILAIENQLVGVLGRLIWGGGTVDLSRFSQRVQDRVREWLSEDPKGRARRVGDELRKELFGGESDG